MILYHGGRNLETNYRHTINHKNGDWEYGPGLYLTNHYDTAREYAKGGGKVYKVHLEDGVFSDDVSIPLAKVVEFVKLYVKGSLQKGLIKDFTDRSKDNAVNADTIINIVINDHAITNNKSGVFKDFLADNGVDFIKSTRYQGRDETIVIVVNAKKIRKVTVVDPKTIGKVDAFVLPITESLHEDCHPNEYPLAGRHLDGLEVLSDIPNMGSIESSFDREYKQLKGVRAVPLNHFNGNVFYSHDDQERSRKLAEEIQTNGKIKPLILAAYESDGSDLFVLEGLHRLQALHFIAEENPSMQHFPALIVLADNIKEMTFAKFVKLQQD